jgi:hypothetical protein
MKRTVGDMQEDRRFAVSRISAEASASAALDEVCRWLIARQSNPVRLDLDDLPALGHDCWLTLALPVTAPRAVLCALWLMEDMDAGGCLMTGHLRFVAHPTGPDIRLSFSGRTSTAIRPTLLQGHANRAARQLVELIAASIERPLAAVRPSLAARRATTFDIAAAI